MKRDHRACVFTSVLLLVGCAAPAGGLEQPDVAHAELDVREHESPSPDVPGDCVDVTMDLCAPNCDGVECGPDGCGGTCGTCPAAAPLCEDGVCLLDCTPDCLGAECGPDGCGGTCGTCPAAAPLCEDGVCLLDCTPDCLAAECGPDGCGGICGTCSDGLYCNGGECQELCSSDPGCDHLGQRKCAEDGLAYLECLELAPNCLKWSQPVLCAADEACVTGECVQLCVPNCQEVECGNDGCGGTCGECAPLEACSAEGSCVCAYVECAGACCAEGDVCHQGACCEIDTDDTGCGTEPWKKWTHSRSLYVGGNTETVHDAVLKLRVHLGAPRGDNPVDEVFLDGLSLDDFSDLRFADAAGAPLKHYLANTGPYEFIQDGGAFGTQSMTSIDFGAAGAFYACARHDGIPGFWKSVDNGENWILLREGNCRLLDVTAQGNLFVADGNLVVRSQDDGQSWDIALDLTESSGAIQPYGFALDSSGAVFAGRYQFDWDLAILRSTQGGAPGTWSTVYANNTSQHVHGLDVDPATDFVYAGLDGDRKIVRSTDGGTSWDVLFESPSADVTDMVFHEGWRVFGCGAGGALYGDTLLRTTDDATFTPVLTTAQTIQAMRIVGDTIYAAGTTYAVNRYPQFYRSGDSGLSWETVWIDDAEANPFFCGHNNVSDVDTPPGDVEQAVFGVSPGANGQVPIRLLSDQPGRRQATFYVRIPEIPPAGTELTLHYGNQDALATAWTAADIFQHDFSLPDVASAWSMDEGEGGALTASGSIPSPGELVVGGNGGWAEGSGSRAGNRYPPLNTEGAHLEFDGDDYVLASALGNAADGATKCTLVAWVRCAMQPGGMASRVVGFGPGNSQFAIVLMGTGGIARLFVQTASGHEIYKLHNTKPICDDQWHQIGVVVSLGEAQNTARMIFDGALKTAVTWETVAEPISGDFSIGAAANGTYGFVGGIDAVQVYLRDLSDTEVQSLFEQRPFWSANPGWVDAP